MGLRGHHGRPGCNIEEHQLARFGAHKQMAVARREGCTETVARVERADAAAPQTVPNLGALVGRGGNERLIAAQGNGTNGSRVTTQTKGCMSAVYLKGVQGVHKSEHGVLKVDNKVPKVSTE